MWGLTWLVVMEGCKLQPWEGVWWIETLPEDELVCTTTYEENFVDAEPPEEVEVTTGWMLEVESEASPAGGYIYVTQASNGRVYVNLDGAVYTGTVDGGNVKVAWDDRYTGVTTSTFEEEYEFITDDDSLTTTAITYSRNSDIRGISGRITQHIEIETTWTESDEWDEVTIGISQGQIPSWVYLTGAERFNRPGTVDCSDPSCTLTTLIGCDSSVTLDGWYAGSSDDAVFDAIDGFEQPAGSP